MSRETLIQEAKRILSDIPDDKWGVLRMYSEVSGRSCAMGLLNNTISGNPYTNSAKSETIAQYVLDFTSKPSSKCSSSTPITSVNDGNRMSDTPYKEKTPKARVMHLLDDMIKAGY